MADSGKVFTSFDFDNAVNINLEKLSEAVKFNEEAINALDPTGKIKEFELTEEDLMRILASAIDEETIEAVVRQTVKVGEFTDEVYEDLVVWQSSHLR